MPFFVWLVLLLTYLVNACTKVRVWPDHNDLPGF